MQRAISGLTIRPVAATNLQRIRLLDRGPYAGFVFHNEHVWMTLRHKLVRRIHQVQLAAHKRIRIVVARPPFENVYYCCTQKTASQWFKAVFSDPIFFRCSGLSVIPHPPGPPSEVLTQFEWPFPKHTIATHLYIDFGTYDKIPKPKHYRTFVVLRDPRDIVVSWYFSTLYSHHPYPKVIERRQSLKSMTLTEGLIYSIDELAEEGLFEMQRSWVSTPKSNNLQIFRYEELARDNAAFLRQLFNYLQVRISTNSFEKLSRRHHFTNYAENRKQGVDDQFSHYRKGVSGDWSNHFNSDVEAYFAERTGHLLRDLGYASSDMHVPVPE